ncbi:phage baseplate assembly protein V [Kaistia nematophila]|uniref:Phage baseplate assembly protein V n=1 Tax=Kaistia nematophila TaxID=2994654 RepID=A0A9X3EE96_9HYPH|nr:phage baseplate assembly protein V [Kaistia nematophila]MCX5571480.1 phage baseplate assembly protein V [Kaistia nematophila]
MGLLERLVEIERKIAEQDRRSRNRRRTGTVSEVDTAKGLARVQIGKGEKPYILPWMPWKEISAGGTSSHIPPTVGQQVDVVSESGDLTDGVIDFSTHSNANPRPHDGPEAVIVHGGTRVTIGDGKVEIVGDVTIRGALTVEGARVSHNGTNIGDSHVHGGVTPGGSDTAPPH